MSFLVAFLVFGAIGASWLVATPLMGVPDEPPHAVRAAAVARGVITSNGSPTVPVPRFIGRAYQLTCFAYHPERSAACQPAPKGNPDEIVQAATTADVNSPVYYLLVGWPSLLLNDDRAFYAMRAMNLLLCSLLAGLTFLALSDLRRHRWAMIGAAVALTPQAFFLTGAVNPNSVELLSAMALFATLLVALRRPSTTRLAIERAGALLVSAALLVSTRSIALLWVVIVVAAVLALSRRSVLRSVLRSPPYLVIIGLTAIVGLISVLWYASYQRVGSDPGNAGAGQSFLFGFATMLQRTFDYWSGWTGIFGWLDLAAPSGTYIVWNTLTLGLVAGAFVVARGRLRLVFALLVAALIFVPPIVQGLLIGNAGIIWQGRYNLALFALVLMTAGIALDTAVRSGRFTYRAVLTISVLMAAAQFAAFAWALRRSAVGEGTLYLMIRGPLWQPPIGIIPTLLLGALTLAAGVVVLTRAVGGPSPRSLRIARAGVMRG
jgi:hypothetical protein